MVIAMSFITGGRLSSSISGMAVVMTRITRLTAPRCTKALTRKRPMPAGAMAKLHSLRASNSAVWWSFMIERASTCDCAGVSTWSEIGVRTPSTLIAGGKAAEMKRSEPLRAVRARSMS